MKTTAVILVLSFAIAAQDRRASSVPSELRYQLTERCELALEQAPAIRGFRLGMTAQDLQREIRGAELIKTSDFGESEWVYEGQRQFELIPRFSGVNRLRLYFIDGSLKSIYIVYDTDAQWQNIERFASHISRSLGLPELWEPDMLQGEHAALVCKEFTVRVQGSPAVQLNADGRYSLESIKTRYSLSITDNSSSGIVNRRKEEQELKKRENFKP